jgi:branched-chain amino acid transport system permease protein
MYAYTRTPLGRIVNAVRDNPERAGFIGYDARWARYLALVLSAFFAGVSGGLSAINFEIVSAENVGAARSGAVLLFTVIGGTGFFAGPMIGAVTGVFLTVMLSDFTRAWQLYIGLFFIAVVLWAPGGMASIVMANLRIARAGCYRGVWPPLWRLGLAALPAAAGAAAAIEMLYRLSLDAAGGTAIRLFGIPADAASPVPWIVALILAGAGTLGARRCYPRFRMAWEDAHAELERRASGERA